MRELLGHCIRMPLILVPHTPHAFRKLHASPLLKYMG